MTKQQLIPGWSSDSFRSFVTRRPGEPISEVNMRNVGSGCPVDLKHVICMIAGKLNRQDLVSWGSLQTAKNDPPLLVADTNRLLTEVGWLPWYDLGHGLEETISWWPNQLAK